MAGLERTRGGEQLGVRLEVAIGAVGLEQRALHLLGADARQMLVERARSRPPPPTTTTALVAAPWRTIRWATPATLTRPPTLTLYSPGQYSPASSPIRASAPSDRSASRTRTDWSSKRARRPAVASRSCVTRSTTTQRSSNSAAWPPAERSTGVNPWSSAAAQARSKPGSSASSRPNAAVGPGRKTRSASARRPPATSTSSACEIAMSRTGSAALNPPAGSRS